MTTRGRTSYRINRGTCEWIMEGTTRSSLEGREPQDGLAGTSRKEQSIEFKDITDGTSNTIMFGEARIGDMSGDSRTGGYGIAAGMANGKAGYGTCEALIGADGKYTDPDNGGTFNVEQPVAAGLTLKKGILSFYHCITKRCSVLSQSRKLAEQSGKQLPSGRCQHDAC